MHCGSAERGSGTDRMLILGVIRVLVFGVFALCVLVALGSWAVRSRRINPFSRAGHVTRKLTDPVLEPIEHGLRRRGGNPQNAGWWLLGGSLVGGILLVTLTEWALVQAARLASAGAAGPRGVLRLFVYYAGQVVTIALIVRVIGSWFGVGRFKRWMRPAYILTDWIVEPLRKVVPRFGMVDISPLVAWVLVQIALSFLLRVL